MRNPSLLFILAIAACLLGCEVENRKLSYLRCIDTCQDVAEGCNRVSQFCKEPTSYACNADHRQCLEVCGKVWSEYNAQGAR